MPESFAELDGCLWEILTLLDPEGVGEIAGEPWSDPAFDRLLSQLALCLRSSGEEGEPREALLAKSALIDRVSHLFTRMVSREGGLSNRILSLNRTLNLPYASPLIPPSSAPPQGLSRRI